MYLFTRRGRLNGHRTRQAMDHLLSMVDYTQQLTGVPIGVWTEVYGDEVGRMEFASFVPDLTALETAMDKIAVDDHWQELAEKALEYTTAEGLHDHLATVVHPEPLPGGGGSANYTLTIDSACLPGQLMRGMALGVEVAQRAEALTGRPVLFLADETNRYAGVHWIFQYHDAAEMEALGERLLTDMGFMQLVDGQAASVYDPDPRLTHRSLHRRVH